MTTKSRPRGMNNGSLISRRTFGISAASAGIGRSSIIRSLFHLVSSQATFMSAFLSESTTALATAKSDCYALLIGVNRYNHAALNSPQLKFPEKDARAVGEFLKDSGYTVKYLLGDAATLKAIEMELDMFSSKGNSEGVLVLGMFGHGVEMQFPHRDERGNLSIEVEGCFCPYDTRMKAAMDPDGRPLFQRNGTPMIEPVEESLLRMRRVMGSLRVSSAGSRVVFADCCREVPNRARGRNLGLGAGLRTSDLPTNSAVLFGCAPGEISSELDEWQHGAFTKCLLNEMKSLASDGQVTTGTLGDRVKRGVLGLTRGHRLQVPQIFQTDSVDLQIRSPGPDLLQSPFSASAATNARNAWATHLSVASSFTSKTGMKFVLIPPGQFLMGSSKEDVSEAISANFYAPVGMTDCEEPQHPVRITNPFYLGVYEVTQAEWRAVMGENPSIFSSDGESEYRDKDLNGIDTSRYPVDCVSWEAAVDFCTKLGDRDGRKYRLPTEAEWEYACRAGTTTPFHFGRSLNGDKANVSGRLPYPNGGSMTGSRILGRTTAVGRYQPNGFGLYDMSGNVGEYCFDWYDEKFYSRSPKDNPVNLEPGKDRYRVVRGGGYDALPWSARSMSRGWESPDSVPVNSGRFGFRVACDAKKD